MFRPSVFPLLAIALAAAALVAQEAEPLVITESTTLPGGVLKRPIVIRASGVEIDGAGTVVQGPGVEGNPASFSGAGIAAEGVSDVRLRGVTVRGWRIGLEARDGNGWIVEDCDFSGNFHDPDAGWGDGPRAGGVILTRMRSCRLLKTKGARNWNGLDLQRCDDNVIDECDWSHCSNVGVKLETSSRNIVGRCDISWGLRIRPGEVHARDSTGVLIESGSNGNRFEDNDVTHGGDGIFIRVLNGWVSTGNFFRNNDCSYANNNGVESWSPGNTFIGNTASHCSYGFWLGGSDDTTLVGNRAEANGRPDGFHNAPEADFGHGGIVIVGGSGTHLRIERNLCHDNAGGGIVFRGDLATRGKAWRTHHVIVQRNDLRRNRWGIFARFADDVVLASNNIVCEKPDQQPEFLEEVSDVLRLTGGGSDDVAPAASIEGPAVVRAGKPATFKAVVKQRGEKKPIRCSWKIVAGDWSAVEARGSGDSLTHTFAQPGFRRVSLTGDDGGLAAAGRLDVYVVRGGPELGTEDQPAAWTAAFEGDPQGRGRVAFANRPQPLEGLWGLEAAVDPYPGSGVALMLRSAAPWKVRDESRLTFWLHFENENLGGFQGINPIVRLHSGKASWSYLPCARGVPRNLPGDLPYSEARAGWLRVEIPVAGSDSWKRFETFDGAVPPHLDHGLRFTTVITPVETQDSSALVSDGTSLWCASVEGDRLFRSADGRSWQELPGPAAAFGGGHGGWMSGALAFSPSPAPEGTLYLRHVPAGGVDAHPRLAAFDIATGRWRAAARRTSITHGAAVLGAQVYGLAHARAGNFGGPLARLDLADPESREERSVPAISDGPNPEWFSRAAQLVAHGGRLYGTKNDWVTPQPVDAAKVGDRLFEIDPAAFRASTLAGGDPDEPRGWKAATTPVRDLGPLPFEIGHGSSLVALPPRWTPSVGARGALFLVAACSPSDHEGFGTPSNAYAIYDLESARWTAGSLPAETGTGTSAAFHRGQIVIKRGGLNFALSNAEAWIVEPAGEPDAETDPSANSAAPPRMTAAGIDSLSLHFDSLGERPFRIALDGLRFE